MQISQKNVHFWEQIWLFLSLTCRAQYPAIRKLMNQGKYLQMVVTIIVVVADNSGGETDDGGDIDTRGGDTDKGIDDDINDGGENWMVATLTMMVTLTILALMQKSSYFPTIWGYFLAILGKSWLTLAIFWLLSG